MRSSFISVVSAAGLLAAALATAPVLAQDPETGKPTKTAKPIKTIKAMKLTAPNAGPPPSQAELVARRDAKLAKKLFKNADWMLDFDAAKKRAAEQDKLILVYFTRSYAP